MPQTKPIVSIENVVASATVNQTVNLNLITQIFPDVEYHPDQFPGLVFRLRSPKTATLIFSSGKMVCTGAKSEKMAIQAVKSVVLKLKKGGIPLEHEPQIEIQNIVASASLGGKIHLELAVRARAVPGPYSQNAGSQDCHTAVCIRQAGVYRCQERK
jgi:transcription initiation factor TFIID TATA-box-binding protein